MSSCEKRSFPQRIYKNAAICPFYAGASGMRRAHSEKDTVRLKKIQTKREGKVIARGVPRQNASVDVGAAQTDWKDLQAAFVFFLNLASGWVECPMVFINSAIHACATVFLSGPTSTRFLLPAGSSRVSTILALPSRSSTQE